MQYFNSSAQFNSFLNFFLCLGMSDAFVVEMVDENPRQKDQNQVGWNTYRKIEGKEQNSPALCPEKESEEQPHQESENDFEQCHVFYLLFPYPLGRLCFALITG